MKMSTQPPASEDTTPTDDDFPDHLRVTRTEARKLLEEWTGMTIP